MEKYQKELDEAFKELGWGYWTPHEILVRLMEETGELARLVNHLYGPKKKKDSEAEQDVEEEIGDIIYTLICYANANGLSLDKAIRKSLDKVIARDKDRFNQK
jgi:NTP pyrophosphatase (non-canonical NTP hydrolase)